MPKHIIGKATGKVRFFPALKFLMALTHNAVKGYTHY